MAKKHIDIHDLNENALEGLSEETVNQVMGGSPFVRPVYDNPTLLINAQGDGTFSRPVVTAGWDILKQAPFAG